MLTVILSIANASMRRYHSEQQKPEDLYIGESQGFYSDQQIMCLLCMKEADRGAPILMN